MLKRSPLSSATLERTQLSLTTLERTDVPTDNWANAEASVRFRVFGARGVRWSVGASRVTGAPHEACVRA